MIKFLHLLVGALEHLDYFSHHIGRSSSSQLTFTPSFFRGGPAATTNQIIIPLLTTIKPLLTHY
jgi:hypothetical protein